MSDMTEELRSLQKKIVKTKRYLSSLEARFQKVRTMTYGMKPEEQRLEKLKQELRKEYPEIEFTPKTMRLLRLVGTLPYSPVERDKEDIAEAVAREYL